MIRINLLPRAVVKGPGPSIRNQAIVAGIIVLVSLIGIFVIPNFGVIPINSTIALRDADIAKAKEELKQVEQYRKRLEQIKKLNRSIEEKLKIIDDIEKQRTGPVWLMDEMTDAVSRFRVTDPKTGREEWQYLDNKVFIQKFDVSMGAGKGKGKTPMGSMSIEGMAINNTYLVAFLNNLKYKNYLFAGVTLHFSDQTNYQGAIVRKFKITAGVKLTAKPGVVTAGAGAAGQGEEGTEQEGATPAGTGATPGGTGTTPGGTGTAPGGTGTPPPGGGRPMPPAGPGPGSVPAPQGR